MQFKGLLIKESAFLGYHLIRVKRASGALSADGSCGIGALSAGLSATKTKLDLLGVGVIASGTLPRDGGGLDTGAAS